MQENTRRPRAIAIAKAEAAQNERIALYFTLAAFGAAALALVAFLAS